MNKKSVSSFVKKAQKVSSMGGGKAKSSSYIKEANELAKPYRKRTGRKNYK